MHTHTILCLLIDVFAPLAFGYVCTVIIFSTFRKSILLLWFSSAPLPNHLAKFEKSLYDKFCLIGWSDNQCARGDDPLTGKISFGQRGQPKTGLNRHWAPTQEGRCNLCKGVDVMLLLCQEHQRGDCKNLLCASTQIPLHNICLIMLISQNGLIII